MRSNVMTKFKRIKISVLLALSITGNVYADEASDKTRLKLAQQVTALDGTIPSMEAVKASMIQEMRQGLPPYIKEDFFVALDDELNIQDLVAKTQQLYARTFTEAELQQWISFYNTPEGKSIAKKMPVLAQDVMTLSQEWGKEAGERVLLLMQAKKQK